MRRSDHPLALSRWSPDIPRGVPKPSDFDACPSGGGVQSQEGTLAMLAAHRRDARCCGPEGTLFTPELFRGATL
jgi:hypothetical protein